MNNLDLQYQALVRDILENGVRKKTVNGETISVFGRQIRHNLKDGFPLLTTKKMYWKGIVTELIWFLRGDTNIKFLVDNDCHIWDGDAYKKYCKVASQLEEPDYYYHVDDPNQNRTRILTQDEFIERIKNGDEKFITQFGELGPIYGKQWREWSNYRQVGENPYICEYRKEDPIDQIENLIKELKENPDSRRMLVSAWNVSDLENMTLPPCHYSFQVYTRELREDEKIDLLPEKKNWDDYDTLTFKEKIEKGPQRAISLMFNCRSQDVPLGTPFNIASYALLLNFIAKVVNMVPEEIIGNFGDCHIYSNQINGLKEQLDRKPYKLPSLILNTEFWPNNMENGDPVGFSENVGHIIENLEIDDFILDNYISHPNQF